METCSGVVLIGAMCGDFEVELASVELDDRGSSRKNVSLPVREQHVTSMLAYYCFSLYVFRHQKIAQTECLQRAKLWVGQRRIYPGYYRIGAAEQSTDQHAFT